MVARTCKPVCFVSWSRDADTGLPALKNKEKGDLKSFLIFYIELERSCVQNVRRKKWPFCLVLRMYPQWKFNTVAFPLKCGLCSGATSAFSVT